MSNGRGKQDVETVLQHPLGNFLRPPRSIFKSPASRGIAINQTLYSTIHVLEEDSVRTSPTTPNTTKK